MTSAASAHFKTAQRRQRCVPRSMFTGRRWRWQLTTRLRSSSPPVLVSMRYGVAALSCPRPTPCPMPISFQMDIHLEMMHAIGEVQDAPVVADIDTGFGNAVNVAYVIPRAGQGHGLGSAPVGQILGGKAAKCSHIAAVAQPVAEMLHAEPAVEAARRVPVKHLKIDPLPAALDGDGGKPGHQPPSDPLSARRLGDKKIFKIHPGSAEPS